eukprot:5454232-Amphidinium_carterae.1
MIICVCARVRLCVCVLKATPHHVGVATGSALTGGLGVNVLKMMTMRPCEQRTYTIQFACVDKSNSRANRH